MQGVLACRKRTMPTLQKRRIAFSANVDEPISVKVKPNQRTIYSAPVRTVLSIGDGSRIEQFDHFLKRIFEFMPN